MPPYLERANKSSSTNKGFCPQLKTVFLRPGKYGDSVNKLRGEIESQGTGHFDVQLVLPYRGDDVHLQLRCKDKYIIGFRGEDGWYHFEGEKDGWGESCRVKCNYGVVPETIDWNAVDTLGELAWFKVGEKEFKSKYIVIAAAVVSESVRFEKVAEQFTEFFNRPSSVIPLRNLRDQYFTNWGKQSKKNDPGVLAPTSASVASSSSSRR